VILPTPGRLTWIGALLFFPGLYFTLRFASGGLRMIYRKLSKRKAYLKGTASDYFWFASACLVVTLVGVLLLAAATVQSGMQPFEGAQKIGTVRVASSQNGRIHLILDVGEAHPGRSQVESDLPGVRWALQGEFVRWKWGPRALGFADGHRVEAILGSFSDTGDPQRPEESRALVAGAHSPWVFVNRHPSWVPALRTSVLRTPWMSSSEGIYDLIVTDQGYVLVAKRESPANGTVPAPDSERSGKR
jgi:hypothetical protein